jgi:hypothetical protein
MKAVKKESDKATQSSHVTTQKAIKTVSQKKGLDRRVEQVGK